MLAARGISKPAFRMPTFNVMGKGLSQLPANYASDGRFIAEIGGVSGRTTGGTLLNGGGWGLSVWDFNVTTSYYELTNHVGYTDYWGYVAGHSTSSGGMANRNTWFAMGGAAYTTSLDTKAYVARIDIATKPASDITFVSPYTYRYDQPTVAPEFVSNVIGNGTDAAFQGYYESSNLSTSDGYVSKATTGGVYGQNSGAHRTDLPYEGYRGQPCLGITMCGGASPNGYAIVTAGGYDYGTTVNLALSNLNANPITARVATLTYSGYQATNPVVAIDATRFVCFDGVTTSGLYGRASIVYTNSATTPTSITQGGTCQPPTPPSGNGFTIDDVTYVRFAGWSGASNLWFGGGNSILAVVYWHLKSTSTLANGDSSYYMYGLVKLTATGTSTLTATNVTTDINGKTIPMLTAKAPYLRGNYSMYVIGAPGNKGVFFYLPDGTTTAWEQRTIQL